MGAPFVWFDLTTTGDTGAAVQTFYAELLGWTAGPAAGDYHGWFTDGDRPWAGVLPTEPANAGRWVPYVVVDDLDAAAKQAVALGGTVVRDKATGPAGNAVLVADPAGATVALFAPAGA